MISSQTFYITTALTIAAIVYTTMAPLMTRAERSRKIREQTQNLTSHSINSFQSVASSTGSDHGTVSPSNTTTSTFIPADVEMYSGGYDENLAARRAKIDQQRGIIQQKHQSAGAKLAENEQDLPTLKENNTRINTTERSQRISIMRDTLQFGKLSLSHPVDDNTKPTVLSQHNPHSANSLFTSPQIVGSKDVIVPAPKVVGLVGQVGIKPIFGRKHSISNDLTQSSFIIDDDADVTRFTPKDMDLPVYSQGQRAHIRSQNSLQKDYGDGVHAVSCDPIEKNIYEGIDELKVEVQELKLKVSDTENTLKATEAALQKQTKLLHEIEQERNVLLRGSRNFNRIMEESAAEMNRYHSEVAEAAKTISELQSDRFDERETLYQERQAFIEENSNLKAQVLKLTQSLKDMESIQRKSSASEANKAHLPERNDSFTEKFASLERLSANSFGAMQNELLRLKADYKENKGTGESTRGRPSSHIPQATQTQSSSTSPPPVVFTAQATTSHTRNDSSGNEPTTPTRKADTVTTRAQGGGLSKPAKSLYAQLCAHKCFNCTLCLRITSFIGKNAETSDYPSHNLITDDPTMRPSEASADALQKVIAALKDEHKHLRLELADAVQRYDKINACTNSRLRESVGKEIVRLVAAADMKANQLYALRDAEIGFSSALEVIGGL